jgi:hypothetical protein
MSGYLLAPVPASAAPSLQIKLEDDANEIQWVQVGATAGDFRLSFGAGGPGVSETADISVPATSAQIQNALNVLANISAGGGSVSVSGGNSGGTYTVAFDGGPLAHADVPLLSASDGTTPLSGEEAGVKVLIQTLDQVGVNRGDEQIGYTATVANSGVDPTSGEVRLEIGLPAGLTTSIFAVSGEGWSCAASAPSGGQSAHAVCTRSTPLPSGASYPPVKLKVVLGADAPDRAIATATATCLCAPAPGSAIDEFIFAPPPPFGIQSSAGGFFGPSGPPPSGTPYTQAGGHPFLAAASALFTSKRRHLVVENSPLDGYVPTELLEQAIINLPRGEAANPLAAPVLCSNLEACPAASAVGAVSADAGTFSERNLPIFAIKPEAGAPAQFAFSAGGNVYALTARLRPGNGYRTSLELVSVPKSGLLDLRISLCDFGAVMAAGLVVGCRESTDPQANPRPLLTNPTRCDPANPPGMSILVNSWEHPDAFAESSIVMPPLTGCDLVPFEPRAQVTPTGSHADGPSGLDVEVTIPVGGFESRDGIAQANLDNVAVTLSPGMSFNPSAADGLGACGKDQIQLGSDAPVECPESARIGTAEIETPLFEETLSGAVYLADQGEVDGSTIGLYLVFESKQRGVLVKVPATVIANPRTGQLVLGVEEIPEIPFSALRLHFAEGPRALLIAPPRCGGYESESELSPWTAADPAQPTPAERVSQTTGYSISRGPAGGPCPDGALEPQLSAGTEDAAAGRASPLLFRLSRDDGTQRFSGLSLTTPPGLTAHLRGIPYCPDAALASIPSAEGSGRAEIDDPACPAASRIGVASLGVGAGPSPLFLDTGRVYLAGPYRGAPLSAALVVPAVIGPLDLGNVVLREALDVDPTTAQVTFRSDPLPRILHGILLDVREVRIDLNRPGLTHNPTDCDPLSIGAEVSGDGTASASVSRRFQATGCEHLPFKPKLRLGLTGATERNGHPAMTATLTQAAGQANVGSLSLTLPRSELLAQEHIRDVCARAQFAEHACPDRSIYGHAEVETPLMEQPLSGPVYLRASDHKLPDLVLALTGPPSRPIEIDLVGRVDSVNGRIRNTFEALPDAPISRVVLKMQGGRKGLLANSRDLCAKRSRATVRLIGQNGKRADRLPVVRSQCGRVAKKSSAHRGKSHARRAPSQLLAGLVGGSLRTQW